MSYSSDIPETDPLQNAQGEQHLANHNLRAPAIQTGNALDLDHVTQVTLENRGVKRLLKMGSATPAEAAARKIRKHQVIAEHAGGGPVTMAQLQQQLQPLVTTAQLQPLVTTAQLQQQLQQQSQQLTALLKNTEVKRFNERAFRLYNDNPAARPPAQELRPCLKLSAGPGPGLPNHPPSVGLVNAEVGTVAPANLFPATVQNALSMSHQQLSDLSSWFNDDFGVVAGENLAMRRRKFKQWIS